jgi:hypothetical protein
MVAGQLSVTALARWRIVAIIVIGFGAFALMPGLREASSLSFESYMCDADAVRTCHVPAYFDD